MPDIQQTEASLVQSTAYMREGKITMLAGNVGMEHVRLYNSLPMYQSLPHQSRPYIGVGFRAMANNNLLYLTSTCTLTPLYKGDTVTFHFEDGTRLSVETITGGFKMGKEKQCFTGLSDHQLAHLIKGEVSHIEVYNQKAFISLTFEYAQDANLQYSTVQDAKKLLRIMAERIVACKALLLAGN